MPEKIFIGVAWPYANGSLHLGQIAGAYLPPDIFARYHRLQGQPGAHGLRHRPARHADHRPRRAGGHDARGRSSTRFHQEFVDSLASSSASATTSTRRPAPRTTPNVVQDIFLRLLREGRHLPRQDAAALLHRRAALPARPLRRGHLPASAATTAPAATSATTAATRSTRPS